MSSFFEKIVPRAPRSPEAAPVRKAEKGGPAAPGSYEERMRALWPDMYPEEKVEEELRPSAGKRELFKKVEKAPRGCLFKVETGLARGYFDLDGYWCLHKGGKEYEVMRGAPRFVNAALTDRQRRELEKARLNARRNGVR